ncbi:MAG: hypothetical protein IT518_08010 [Burkholderiales bacterium]|nr:hypothetical protein [Burkholderiales bacterium]
MSKESTPEPQPLVWLASAKNDLMALPAEVINTFGYALHLAQTKKAKSGIAMPKQDMDLIRARLKAAEQIAKELSK